MPTNVDANAAWFRALCGLMLIATIFGCQKPETAGPATETGDTVATHSHDTPGETCFLCDPTKRDPARLWCKEHGRYEDRCFLCHPELEDQQRLFCAEHFLYEDECFLCHPELTAQPESAKTEPQARVAPESTDTVLRAALSDLPARLFCAEHHVDEHECGICHPELLGGLEVGQGLKVRLASAESARKAGVRIGRADTAQVTAGVHALGQLVFDGNKRAAVSPLADGVLRNVFADVGQTVEQGELLAEVNSSALADAKSDLVQALVESERSRQVYDREKALSDRQIASKQDYEEAAAMRAAAASDVDRARQQLLNLGLSEDEVATVVTTQSTSSILPVRAPFAGTIIAREAVLGAAVEAGSLLFEVADLTTMWLELSVPETEAFRLKLGADVQAQFDAIPGESFAGTLTWIASDIDETTRTVNARASFPNPESRLRSGLFGRAMIAESNTIEGLTVPVDAVQVVDGRPVVFARLEDDLYETRIVRTGAAVGDRLIVLAGLSSADEIAVSDTFILKSELLKARLGAGCVDE